MSDDVGGGRCVGFDTLGVGWGLGEEMMRKKRATTSVIARFCDTLDGPPTCWVPPCVSLPPIPPSSKYVPAHIPLERGGVGADVVWFVRPGVLMVEPTSLNRGERLVAGLLRVVAGELWWRDGGEGSGGGGGMRAISTVMRLMLL